MGGERGEQSDWRREGNDESKGGCQGGAVVGEGEITDRQLVGQSSFR